MMKICHIFLVLQLKQVILFSFKMRTNEDVFQKYVCDIGTRKAEVLNSLIINATAKANDTTDILQTFRFCYAYCYALKMITVVIETFARCQLYRLLWP